MSNKQLRDRIVHLIEMIKQREVDRLLADKDYNIMTIVDANTILRLINEPSKIEENGN